MNSDIREIEGVLHALARKRKVVFVNRATVLGVPILAVEHYDGDIIALFVHKGIQTSGGA